MGACCCPTCLIVLQSSLIGSECGKLQPNQDSHIQTEICDYKYKGMKPAEIRFSLQRPLQHRDTTMAPAITAAMTSSQEHLMLNHKLRKPQVEKLRRERINSSIEQLKSLLLGADFLKQQPDSKLEKADILEMTVCFLRQLQKQHPDVDSGAVELGYSKCVQEAVHFLFKDEEKTQSQRKLLKHFSMMESSSKKNLRKADFSPQSSTEQGSVSKDKNPLHSALWRPW